MSQAYDNQVQNSHNSVPDIQKKIAEIKHITLTQKRENAIAYPRETGVKLQTCVLFIWYLYLSSLFDIPETM